MRFAQHAYIYKLSLKQITVSLNLQRPARFWIPVSLIRDRHDMDMVCNPVRDAM
jgi:hypothetical protein